METQTIDAAAKSNKTPPPFEGQLKGRQAPYYEGSYYEDGKLQMIFYVSANPKTVAVIAQEKLQSETPEYKALIAAYMSADDNTMTEKEVKEFIATALANPRRRLFGNYDRWLDTNACRFEGKSPIKLQL